jgi:uncharacterized protein (TIGR02246 family)
MRGRIDMRHWMAALVVLVLVAGLAPAAGAGDEDDVKAIGQAWAEAWDAGDMDAIGALYAEDADYVNFFGERISGRAAIQAAFAELNSTVYKGTTIEVEPVAVSFIAPDVAVTDTVWKLAGVPDDAPPLPTEGQSTVVAVKQGDVWKIAAHRTRVPQSPVTP